MQVRHVDAVVAIVLRHHPHAKAGRAGPRGHDVVDLQDHHVAAVATALFEQATGSGALLHRHHHLEEGVADRHHRILEAVLGDCRIIEADLDAEDMGDVVDHRGEPGGHQRNLTKSHHGDFSWDAGGLLRWPLAACASERLAASVSIRGKMSKVAGIISDHSVSAA